jgi:endonuclease/exonuclease/phosphatase family metal-dependent hydrolase
MYRTLAACLVVALAIGCSSEEPAPFTPGDGGGSTGDSANPGAPGPTVRVASYNASLFRGAAGELVTDLRGGNSEQAQNIATVVQTVRPDILLVNEIDFDEDGEAARILAEEYFAVGQGDLEGITYEHRLVPRSNTGVHSGVDLDGNGEAVSTPGSQEYGNDAFGFGQYEGQYGFAVFSRFPIDEAQTRTFRELLWQSMPDNLLPTDFYSSEAQAVFRLSSKNHADVVIDVDGFDLHLLASHPTPPSFDGPEDRNGRRNHDEIRFWVDYISGEGWMTDDSGAMGGIADGAKFVVVGDLNSDPNDGSSRREALLALLGSELTTDPRPASEGGVAAAMRDGQANTVHEGDPALDTADFSDGRVGNLRVDYALPSSNLDVGDSGVFWPADGPGAEAAEASDHRLVWVDVTL